MADVQDHLGACYPEQWGPNIDGPAIVSRFAEETGAGGYLHLKVFESRARPAGYYRAIVRAAEGSGMGVLLRYVPSRPMAVPPRAAASDLVEVAEAILPRGCRSRVAFGNWGPHNAPDGWQRYLRDVATEWMLLPAPPRKPRFLLGGDVDPAMTMRDLDEGPSVGAHAYGKQGWDARHVAPWRSRMRAEEVVLDEAGWWFPPSSNGASDWPGDLTSAEVGGFWLDLVEAGRKANVGICLYSLQAMFRRDGSTTPAYDVLTGARPRPERPLRAARLKAWRNYLRLRFH